MRVFNDHHNLHYFEAVDIYKELIQEKYSTAPMDQQSVQKRMQMKEQLLLMSNCDNISLINIDELKKAIESSKL